MTFRHAGAVAFLALMGVADVLPIAIRAAAQQPSNPVIELPLTAGRSIVLTTEYDVIRVAVTNPAVADATVVEPREILIDGKAPGTVSLIVWGTNRRTHYDVIVNPGVSGLQQQLRGLFPGEDINVTINEEATTLSGRVSNNAVMLRAGEIAAKTSSKSTVINLLQVPGGIESQQVLLQVRFAEVNRQLIKELGVGLFTSATGIENTIGRITAEQFPAPTFTDLTSVKQSNDFGAPVTESSGKINFSDFLNLFLFNQKYDLGAVIKALQTRGYLQSLAEPNLIAYNGQEASFLAGGEVPIPVVSGTAGNVSVTYKEFGVRLSFRPTIAGDVIRLHVKPEVSSLDFANGVTLAGFRIPALTTRRAETEVELRDGQSFAIAGLLNNISQDTRQSIPFLSRIPIIGNLFKSMADRREQTELMVLITPRLVRPLDPDEVAPLPTDPNRFLPIGPVEDAPAPPTPAPPATTTP